MPKEAQVYKQEPGAVTDAGHVIEPGWYWVRMRPPADATLPFIPYGPATGPFKTWRRAERDYQELKDHEDKVAARNALHGKYGHLTPEELCERINHCWKVTQRGHISVQYKGRGHYYEHGTGFTFHRRRKDIEASLERFEDRFAREEAERPAKEAGAREEARKRAIYNAAEDMLKTLQVIAWAADGGRQMVNPAVSTPAFNVFCDIRDKARAAIAKAEGEYPSSEELKEARADLYGRES